MDSVLVLLPALGCVLMMPAMMWMMSRMTRGDDQAQQASGDPTAADHADEVRKLRHEVDRLRFEADTRARSESPDSA